MHKEAGTGSLPVTHDLKLVFVSSLVIAILMAVTTLAGLLFPDSIYPSEELVLAFAPVDLFHLVVGLPVLLFSMWLARRGSLAGLLCWPGALIYALYTYMMNLIGVPFGVLFLPYLLLVTLSAYTIIGLVACIDIAVVRRRLAGAVPDRAAGIVLVVLTGLFMLMAVGAIIAALANQTPVGQLDLMLWITDLGVIGPVALVGGVLLLRRTALGYMGGTGLLLTYSMLFFGLVPVMLFLAAYDGSPIDAAGLVMMVAAGTICLVLFALFVRGATKRRTQPNTH